MSVSPHHNLEDRDECLVCAESVDDNGVQCEKCKRWAHFSCVGVDETASTVDWLCRKCLPLKVQELTVPKQHNLRSRKTSKGEAGSDRGASAVQDPTEQSLEEEQLTRERAFAKQMEIRKKRIEQEIAWNEKRLAQEREMQELEFKARREMQRRQLEQERMLLQIQEAEEREFQKQLDSIRSKMNRSSKTPFDGEAGAVGGEPETVMNWLQHPGSSNHNSPAVDRRGAYEKGGKPVSVADPPQIKDRLCPVEQQVNDQVRDDDERRPEQYGDGPGHRNARLTPDQLATRKAICNSLPRFNGDAQTWPLFISSYEHSTAACGYSNLENLKRLQDSLEGEALNAVRSMLVLPESVPEVIEDLRRLFGQPEKLMRTLLVKVRNAPAPKADRLGTFISFGITVKQLCDHLEAARLTDHLNNPMMVQELVEKLPANYKLDWVRYKRGKEGTPLRKFTNFITDIVADVSEVADYSAVEKEIVRPGKGNNRTKEYVHVHDSERKRGDGTRSEVSSKACWICNRTDHRIRFCDDFRRMNVAERLRAVERQKLCGLCLNKHGENRCESKQRCHIRNCQGKHHPLLHRVEESVQLQKAECNALKDADCSVIFRMMRVTLYVGKQQFDTVAFLDEGSSATLVDNAVAKRLKAEGTLEPLIVTWTGNINRFENGSRKVELMISAKGSQEKFPLFNTRTVTELQLPKQNVRYAEIVRRYQHLAGVPVKDDQSGLPTILIGLDNLYLFAPLESRVGKPSEPIAVRSKLGWTIYGSEKRKPSVHTYLNLHSVSPVSNQELHDMIREQYVLDETAVASFAVPEPAEEKRAREILESTTKRVGNRFETGLLWKKDVRWFPDSYPMAVRRLRALDRKLERDPALKQNVCQQIEDYQAKGYAHKITAAELERTPSSEVWYLPVNVVLNPRKPGKVRLVWDAAASVGGVSLNSELLKGPDMLVPLPKVICCFREGPVAFGGDVQEMYHQMLMRAEDKQALRFLFGTDPTGKPQVFVMDVATFGATCSPCSAQFVKNLNAEQFMEEFPEAAAAIRKKHYVDDYYDSVDTVEEAIQRAKQVKYIHSQGGFHIRNWVSNSETFLEELGERSVNAAVHFTRDKGTEYERVLGIVWEPVEDVFCFATASKAEFQKVLNGEEYPTKRIVLSFVMAQFDPVGFLTPITVCGKMLIQDLWRTGCDWDARIDEVSFKKWQRWIQMMRNIGSFKLPRSYFGNARSGEITELQLHVFADASETAYGCVAYFRAIVRGEVKCALVMSRSKVTPLKQISIPRLELLAAVLGARLSRTVLENHDFKISRVVYWTDANVVLSWIRSDQRRYKQFVGFRIGEILSLTKLTDWRWVPTRFNVADQLTKWSKDPEMHLNSTWVRGPTFLYKSEDEWPKKELPPANTTEELRVHLLLHDVKVPDVLVDANRFSKWTVLVRTVACVFRFVSNCKRKLKGLPIEALRATDRQMKVMKPRTVASIRVPLQQSEYEKAVQFLVKMAQAENFVDELKILMRNKDRPINQWMAIEKTSPLYKLTPLVDENGLIRMEGRVERAEFLPFDLRFPAILPNDHRITMLIVQHYHEKSGHGYRQAVKNELRQLYYIPHVDSVVRKVSSLCIWCKVHRSRPQVPRMAPLPVQRLTPNLRPFSYVGVDYLGPFDVTVGRRTEKRWIALFTCLVTRAVHLEVAHGLTTQSCLMAVYRFIGRRGWPFEFFSDNGTNLRGASKEIVEAVRDIGDDCADQITNARTKWTFNPPAAPHMGGVWERLVRSVKEALTALDDGRRLTDEILQTAIVEAEDIINSRPLTYVSQQSNEAEALTPNHFLRGASPNQPNTTLPTIHPAVALRDAFQRSQQLANVMWERWIKEYVPSLNQRTKWFGETKPLQAGDLVYVVEGSNRKCWIRGVVEEPIVSGDGRIRQAWVRTNSGRFKRATAKLAVMEISEGNSVPGMTSGTGLRAGECSGNAGRAPAASL